MECSSDLMFEPYWDDRAQKWRVMVFGLEDEGVNLPSAVRVSRNHPLWRAALAATQAAPTTMSDREGIYWADKSEAQAGADAAAKVPK